ncbi:MAG: hypothetical protein NC191_05815 [Muribaculaceae bacterium]|nr:hypothetical protein [Muribaculaceae bacterium]
MRTDNLIQTYINSHPATRQYNTDKAVKNFDVHKELANRTFIKPMPSNGKLIRPSLFDMPSEISKGIRYDINAFKHAISGKANDHELGRLNDVGMKVGGLAIASYLFTRKHTPMTKVFEFIGLTTFFGAMNIWPKLFLQLPARIVHGFDIRQKYEDNYGRKKMVFSDHQFIPWDLYSDKEINKVGDRLRVPKDIPNRREFIQEKMRKIALQNNTMWMLTSGFATPLLSALICNRLEAPVAKFLHNRKDKQSEALLTNFPQEVNKHDSLPRREALDKILSKNKNQPLTNELVNSIVANITQGQDPAVVKSVADDLRNLMPVGEHFAVGSEIFDNVRNVIKESLSPAGLSAEDLAKILPDNETMLRALTDKGLLGADIKEFSSHSLAIQELLAQRIKDFTAADPNSRVAKKLEFCLDKLIHQARKGADSPLETAFKTKASRVLTEDIAKTVKAIGEVFDSLTAKINVLDKYAHIKVAQDQETIIADIWNQTADGFVKALHLTPQDIAKSRLDSKIAGDVLRERIETIVSDKKACADLVSEMEKLLSVVYSKTAPLENRTHLYHSTVDSTFADAAESLRAFGLDRTVDSLLGFGNDGNTGIKGVAHNFMNERITGVRSSFYRILQLINTYYKMAHDPGVNDTIGMLRPREVKEEMAEIVKSVLMEGHTSDFAVKLYQRRNLNPNTDDRGVLKVVDGKVQYDYHGKMPNHMGVSMPNDSNYFSDAMKLMFGDVHPDIADRIRSSVFFNDFQAYREDAIKKLGGERNFAFPEVLVDGVEHTANSTQRFNRLGATTNELMYKLANNKFNSGKWFSMFGKLGAGVIAVTLLSQFFMGKMKKPEPQKENV